MTELMTFVERGEITMPLFLSKFKKSEINVQNKEGDTLLMIIQKHIPTNFQYFLIKILLKPENRIDINIRNKKGEYALLLEMNKLEFTEDDCIFDMLRIPDKNLSFIQKNATLFETFSNSRIKKNRFYFKVASFLLQDDIVDIFGRNQLMITVPNNIVLFEYILTNYRPNMHFTNMNGFDILQVCHMYDDFMNIILEMDNLDINHIDKYGETVLILYCKRTTYNINIIKRIISYPSTVDPRNYTSDTISALFVACSRGHLPLVKLLITDININYLYRNENVLFVCIRNLHIDCVQYLLRTPINVAHTNNFRQNAVMIACTVNMVEIINNLLLVIDVNDMDINKENALFYAIKYKNYDIAIEFVDDINIRQRNVDGKTALMKTEETNAFEISELLLSTMYIVDDDGNNVFMLACQHNNDEFFHFLIVYSYQNFHITNKRGMTPLMYCAINDNVNMADTIMDNYISTMSTKTKRYIRNKCNFYVNRKNKNGDNVLLLSSSESFTDYLIYKQEYATVAVNVVNSKWQNIVMLSVSSIHIIHNLINTGKVNRSHLLRDKDGRNILHYACDYYTVFKKLVMFISTKYYTNFIPMLTTTSTEGTVIKKISTDMSTLHYTVLTVSIFETKVPNINIINPIFYQEYIESTTIVELYKMVVELSQLINISTILYDIDVIQQMRIINNSTNDSTINYYVLEEKLKTLEIVYQGSYITRFLRTCECPCYLSIVYYLRNVTIDFNSDKCQLLGDIYGLQIGEITMIEWLAPIFEPVYSSMYSIFLSQEFVTKTQFKPLPMHMIEPFFTDTEQPTVIFACQNGHLYSGTNCGIPTVITQCTEPLCTKLVGGINHFLVPGCYIVYNSNVNGNSHIWSGYMPVNNSRYYIRLVEQYNIEVEKYNRQIEPYEYSPIFKLSEIIPDRGGSSRALKLTSDMEFERISYQCPFYYCPDNTIVGYDDGILPDTYILPCGDFICKKCVSVLRKTTMDLIENNNSDTKRVCLRCLDKPDAVETVFEFGK